jgi:PAS domain-containing protein
MTGYDREAVSRVSMPDIKPDEELGVELPQLTQLVASEIDSYTIEKRMIRGDGGTVLVLQQVTLVPRPAESRRTPGGR